MIPSDRMWRIWNRGTSDGGELLGLGDTALRSMLRAHGLTMNGGVLHAVELLTLDELGAAKDGYRYFGLGEVAELLNRARALFNAGDDLETYTSALDHAYEVLIPDDMSLVRRFEERLAADPSAFAPVD